MIFENIFEDRKIDYLLREYIYFSIGADEQKLCSSKLKTKEMGQQFFSIDYYYFLYRKL